jgi:cobalamin biosynthesis protein CobD/CbiB
MTISYTNKCEMYKLIILTFIVTALWDVILRILSLYNPIPFFSKNMKFIQYLKPYFQKHTLLAAALIAGFVGAITQLIILNVMNFPTRNSSINYILIFMIWSFIVSALFGFIMKASKLFPYLEMYYYERLGLIRSLYHDGTSGLIVQLSLFFLLFII